MGESIAPSTRWPLVGRTAELARLEDLLEARVLVVLAGAAGVGKSRLAAEVAERAESRGVTAVRVLATESARAIPYGALAPLLPASSATGPGDGHRAAVAALTGEGAETVVVIDDAHLLDPASSAALRQAAAKVGSALLLTIRAGKGSTDVTSLWTDGTATRVELGPIDRHAMETLVARVLGKPVDGATLHELWRASDGNVLFLRELVLGAIDADLLVEYEGIWRLTGRLTGAPRLGDLVAARLADLEPDEHEALGLVAVAEPVGLDVVFELAPLGAVESLERRGLVTVESDGRRRPVRVAHPLHAEYIRSTAPRITTMRMAGELAGAIERRGARRRDDALRVGVWRLDGGGTALPEVMLRAAQLAHARGDDELAARLGLAALDAGATMEAAIVTSVALGLTGRHAESADVIVRHAQPDDPREVATTTIQLSEQMFWGLGRADGAVELLAEVEPRLDDPTARDDVRAQQAVFAMLAGRVDEGCTAALVVRSTDEQIAGRAGIVAVIALALHGQVDAAAELAQRGEAFARAYENGLAQPWVFVSGHALALMESGRLLDARALLEERYSAAASQPSEIQRAWYSLMLGRVELLVGRLATADRWFGEAAWLWDRLGLSGPLRWALSGRILAAAMRGDRGACAEAEERLEAAAETAIRLLDGDRARAHAWADVARGRGLDVDALKDAALASLALGQVAVTTAIAHDLVRLGHAREGRDLLLECGDLDDWPLAATRLQYARAAAARDVDGLLSSADQFEALGAALFAAEAAAAAARSHERGGRGLASDRAAARARRLAAECEGAATPLLAGLGAEAALSRRERDVARLAVDGLTNREIAEQLALSERTVENHLQRAFTKVGVSRREALAFALRPEAED